LTATVDGRTATALITVVGLGSPMILGSATATPNPVAGTTTQLAVRASDESGEAALTYRWATSLAPAAVTFSANDDNAAKNSTATFTAAGAYSFVVDGKSFDFTLDSGMHARVVTIALKPFTLIGATTRAGLLTQALRSRFGIAHHLEYYGHDDLVRILHRAAGILSVEGITTGAFDAIASRSRGTPRIALRLLRRVRDFAEVRANGRADHAAVDGALRLEGVDERGLDELDRKYMRAIASIYGGGPVGLEAVAATLGEDAQTLEDLVEPFLLQIGFLARTRQGRRLTRQGADAIGFTLHANGLSEE
jgi:hypothetical protein